MFMALELDRSNIQQAVTDNFLKELHMNTNGKSNLVLTQVPSLIVSRFQSWQHRLQAVISVCRATVSTGFKMDGTRSLDPCSVNTLVNCSFFSILVERSRELPGVQIDPGYTSRRIHSGCMSSHINSFKLLALTQRALDYPIFIILLQAS